MTTAGAPPARRAGDVVLVATQLYRFFHAGDDETLALRGVSVSLCAGEVLAVTGPSGSGKSTLVACLAGLDEPDGGIVRCGGEPLTRRPEPERAALRAQSIGMVFQGGNLIEHLTVEQNVALAQRLGRRVRRDEIARLLTEVDLGHRATAPAATLSGGEAVRGAIAVALANDPLVMLADEPTGELDQESGDRVMALLRARADAGTAVLVVTHNPDVAAFADREVAMLDGEVVDQ